MPTFPLPAGAVPTDLPERVRLQIVTSAPAPPAGEDWLHEIKHDGHRLIAILAGGAVKLLSRNARERTELFAEPFRALAAAGLPPLVLDGEITVPDERGVTHIDQLSEALRLRRADQLAYFAFDLLFLDGHDLSACAIEDRKALLRNVVGAAGCPRIVTVDPFTGSGAVLFEAVRQIGAEGIVSKRAGSPYRGGVGRDWLKAKVSETGAFVITGYIEGEAVVVAELRDGELVPVGLVTFGLSGKGLWEQLDRLHAGPATRSGLIPVRPELVAGVKSLGRYRSDAIRTACCSRSASARQSGTCGAERRAGRKPSSARHSSPAPEDRRSIGPISVKALDLPHLGRTRAE
jgi:bifunctional non-homologous end joining protein LigD